MNLPLKPKIKKILASLVMAMGLALLAFRLDIFNFDNSSQARDLSTISVVIREDGSTQSSPARIEVFMPQAAKDVKEVLPDSATAIRRWDLTIENNSPQTQKHILWNFFPLMEVTVRKVGSGGAPLKAGLIFSDRSNLHFNHPKFTLTTPPGVHRYQIESRQHRLHSIFAWQVSETAAYDKQMRDLEIATKMFLAIFMTIWLYNVIFFVLVGHKQFNYYSLGAAGLAYCLATLVGLPLDIPAYLTHNSILFLPIFLSLGLVSYWAFLMLFLNIDTVSSKGLFRALCANMIFVMCCGIAGTAISGSLSYFLMVVIFLEVSIYFVSLFLLRRRAKTKYWMIFFWSNSPNVAAVLVINRMYLGQLDLDLRIFFFAYIIVVFLLVTMSVVLGFAAKEEDEERVILETSVQLGRSVQDLLLPQKFSGQVNQLEYCFFYKPYASQMSGDWLQHWVSPDSTAHFLIGDVTGKGPQAALAVAMIAAIVDRCAHHKMSAHQCMLEINSCLFELFQSKILTTASAASIKPNGDTLLYNAGGLGWYVATPHGGTKHHLSRSSVLGFNSSVHLSGIEVNLKPQNLLLTLTDGLGDHSRGLRRMSRNFGRLVKADAPLSQLVHNLSQSVTEVTDDQAMIVLKSLEPIPTSESIAA